MTNRTESAPKVVLRTVTSRAEAEMLANVLSGAGIEAFVASDDCGAVDPALSFVRGVHLFVAEEDQERAEELLGQTAG